MFKLLFLVFIGSLLSSTSSHALTQEQADLIDSVVEQFQVENFVPGFLLSAVQDGEMIITKGYGKRNIDDDLDVDTDTLFAIGSISKVGTLYVKPTYFCDFITKHISSQYLPY